ncbi:thioredoxin family protein [Adlercreutzia equolifaciens]|uniref:thioredoxin family protein n=1 Tax=Adlercreutzia equolifaciens TaxID=446660 RepID=UPI0023B1797F|nr:thioredoxin family protein [Adlercreutzia equolifaciens]MDE8701789.1 thioredoxin family protein [Adlercreutzia equolifaciens]
MIELTKDNFDHEVTEAAGRVLVDFWSPGCGPCRVMEPVLANVASRHPDVKFAKMNAAENPDVAWAFNVVAVPTLVLFENGCPLADLTGAVPAQRIDELLRAAAEDGENAEKR